MTDKKKVSAQYSSLTGIHRAVPIILFAVAVFTMFCFITQDIGALGHAISTVFLGLFSYGAYAIPLLLALHAVFYPSDISEKRVLSRVIFSLIAITFISALSYSITYWNDEIFFDAIRFFKDGRDSVGGGFVGGIVGFCLIKVFGRVGLVIIAVAIFAIYISYFFASGQRSISKVLFGILKAIVFVLALIEMGIKKLFGSVKNAKSEKIKREAEQKNNELTDDEFFAVDNGMQKLSVAELGIKETRESADLEDNPTLHEKIFYKSAVSAEEAERMAMREKAEEMFYQTAAEEPEEEEEPSPLPKRRLVNVTYDDPDSKIGRAPVKEEPEEEAPVFTPASTASSDDNADSIFTGNFDPFGMMMSEELASRPSSKSLLDETPRPAKKTVTEDISELTEADIERRKQIEEFERRKAALLTSRKAIPVENDGEFRGTPKTVDFRERTDESLSDKTVEAPTSSFIFEKTEKTPEPPKAEPANYTAIGFGTEGGSVNYTPPTPAFTVPETIYSYEPPVVEKPEPKPSYYTPASYSEPARESIPASAPYVEEEEVTIFEKKIPDSGFAIYTPASEPATTKYESVPVASAPAAEAKPAFTFTEPKPIVEDKPAFSYAEPKPVVEDKPAFSYTEPKPIVEDKPAFSYAEPKPVVEDKPAFTYAEPKPIVEDKPAFGFTDPAPVAEEKPDVSYTATKNLAEERTADFVPEFKPFEVSPVEEISEIEAEEPKEEESEGASTLTVEREYVGDDSDDGYESDDETEDDETYGSDDDDEDDSDDGVEAPENDSDGFEDEEIPEEERNPVVEGYRDMFSALRGNEPEEEDEVDHSKDYELTSPDEVEDDYNSFDEDDDYDTPPFDEPTVREEPRPKAEKKEEKPKKKKPDFKNYKLPPIDLLGLDPSTDDDTGEITENTNILIETLASFGVTASIKGVDRGPRITRYEVVPARGVKVNAITNLFNDIALNLAKEGIRMEAPIPGKSAIGFEIPNKNPKNVRLRELLECEDFVGAKSKTYVGIGKDVAGNPVFGDIAKYPHALICGATGMGKSVCINSIMVSMLYKARPDEVKFIMIDPKKVEFRMYSGIPHLLIPVITEAKQAAGALMWAVEEMERRYEVIEKNNVRNIEAYNEKVIFDNSLGEPLPKIVIVIDELADLMMQVRDPVEDLVMRIAQKARAAGIHLIIGTQRPSVQVITGAIKANIPSRISCKVTSQVDSRTIFDMGGAEKLLNRGDMLYWPVDKTKALRVQGAFVSDSEVENIMEYLKSQVTDSAYDEEIFAEINKAAQKCGNKKSGGGVSADDIDDGDEQCGYYSDQQFLDAVELAIRSKKVSTSLLQRKLSIGYGKAAKYIDAMEEIGIVSEPNGQKPRDVLLSMDEWHEKLSRVNYDE